MGILLDIRRQAIAPIFVRVEIKVELVHHVIVHRYFT